jgi:hypothetical protein
MNYSKLLSLSVFILYTFDVKSQKTAVVGTETDSNFYNTTVVYKSEAATDMEALLSLNNNIGLGEVVRITTAPPKPKPEPTNATVNKPNVTVPATTVRPNTATTNKPVTATKANTTVSKPVAPVVKSVPTSTEASAPVAKKASTMKSAPKPAVKQDTPASPVQVKAVPAVNTFKSAPSGAGSKVKKVVSKRKSKRQLTAWGSRYKNKKPGKQRYSCPKF